jgi:DNA polymerase III subunit alpha
VSGQPSFAHLHTHTEFSMLDGAARVNDVIAAAVADGQPAIAITDHGNMYGVLDFYRAANDAGIKPIIGIEAYQAADSRFERPVRRGRMDDSGGEAGEGQKLYYHLCLLAESTAGYRNLMKLSSGSFLEGYYYKPRCLLPRQEIVTRTGVKAIKDIVVGDEVLTHRGRFRKVTRTMSRHHEGEVLGVRLAGRYERVTWMTAEHPVLVQGRNGMRKWVEAGELDPGRPGLSDGAQNWKSWACLPKIHADQPVDHIRTEDYVSWEPSAERPGQFVKSSPRSKIGPTRHYCPFPTELPLDYDVGYFIGLFAAEGHTSRGTACWSFHRDEHELIDRCSVMAEKLTGKPVVIKTSPHRPGYQGVTVSVYSAVLAELLGSLCGKGARNKHLPEFVFEAPREFQQGLVDGVLDGDGSVKPDTVIFTQTSRDLAWQIRMLRATLDDDFACVTECELPAEQHATQYRSNYSPRRVMAHRRTKSDREFVYKPISAVLRRSYSGPVYNIEVEDDHSYVSDFAIHNCDWELLEKYSEGVIATTGCLGGVVLQALLRDDMKTATALAGRLQDIFGRNNLFVEVQDHGYAKQQQTNPLLVEVARAIGAPLVATNDCHYTHRDDALAHDALLCVQTGSSIDDPNRFKFETHEHYLKTAAEMRALFAELPEACDNTLYIAERASVDIEFGQTLLPEFPLPAAFTDATAYLRHLAYEGARGLYGHDLSTAVIDRLDYELRVIADMGFSAYFLVVWDLIKYARDHGIRVGPGRGSAAGSCVAYALRIVDLDPLKYGLIFERFLNPGRKSMPDIDMDFDERYRSEMIRYAAERYGWDHVAQIVTFSTIKARAAVRDAARVLGFPYQVGDRIAKAMPPLVMGRDTPLHACLESTPGHEAGYKAATELREMYAADPDAKKVIDVARGLEGLRRQDGIHAAAVVITPQALTEYLPIQRKPEPGGTPESAPIVTQYEMHGVEDLGLLKMDFLGLRNLSVIERALDLIEQSTGARPDIDHIPLDDDATLEMLRKGDSIGVFQLEGGPMRTLMRSLAPTSFDDIAALVALYRPGPMAANMHNDYADRKNNRQAISYLHPDLEGVLGDTQGLMIYQESLMRVAQKFAGYSLEEADNLRKACAKKVRSLMAKEREKFVASVVSTGYGETIGTKLFDVIEPFADYAFPKSHAYCYGYIAYQTAWLKATYPVEYFAALLTSVKDDKDRTAIYLSECRSMGVKVLVPDVNVSESDFIARGDTIPFGLSAIRNVGSGLVAHIVAERNANGPYTDFYDFCGRVDPVVLNKRSIESLVKGGAFDALGHPRKGLCQVFEQIVDRVLERRRREAEGQFDLFGGAPEVAFDDARVPIPDVEFDKMPRLAFEKEMLGLYISDHPLLGAERALKQHADVTVFEAREKRDGEVALVAGVITGLNRRYTKRGDLMATFTLEDLESAIDVWIFPKTMHEYGPILADDAIVCVKGRLDLRDDQPKLVALEVKRPDVVLDDEIRPIRLSLPLSRLTDSTVNRLKQVLTEHPGPCPVLLHVGEKILRLPSEFNVDAQNGLLAEVRVLLGPNALLA